jgi:pyridoxamine 5'-phosphate oxidase
MVACQVAYSLFGAKRRIARLRHSGYPAQRKSGLYAAEHLGRQIRIRGKVTDAGRKESAEDFRDRSGGARAIALTGKQSDVLAARDYLDDAIEAQAVRLSQNPGTVAPHWLLFIVIADEIEFWQGREDRRHQRLRYRRLNENWINEELLP